MFAVFYSYFIVFAVQFLRMVNWLAPFAYFILMEIDGNINLYVIWWRRSYVIEYDNDILVKQDCKLFRKDDTSSSLLDEAIST